MYIQSVGIVVRNRVGLVWAGARADQDEECWQFPQGCIEPGESALIAAQRELWEETGLKARHFDAQSSPWLCYDYPPPIRSKLEKEGKLPANVRGKAQQWFLYAFDGKDSEIKINHHSPEFKSWQWMRAHDFLDSLVAFKKTVIEKVLEEFGFFVNK